MVSLLLHQKILLGKILMKNRVGIFTGSRGEWGYLRPVMEQMKINKVDFKTIIANMHLLPEKGFTYKEILSKSLSLKGVMEPFSSDANLKMLKRAGFKDICTVSKVLCFEGFLAIK